MADYGSYDSGVGDVISAIQRPALDVNEERERILQNVAASNQQAAAEPSQFQQANDLINQAIASRQNIEARRYDLSRRLEGTTNRREAAGIASQIEGLDRAAASRAWEAGQRRIIANESAENIAQQLKIDRSASIDEQGAALMTGLGRLDALHRNGQINDDQYNSHLLDLGQNYGLGLHHPVAGKMYNHYVEEADRRDQFNLRRTAAETFKVAGKYGIEPQIDPETGQPSLELTHAAALQTGKGRVELIKQLNQEMIQKYGVPGGVRSLFNPITPHKETKDGKSIEVPFVSTEGKEGTTTIPKPLFNQMKADFQERYNLATNVPSAAPATSPVPTQQAAGGLEVGTQRTVGGRNYAWNGSRWEQQ